MSEGNELMGAFLRFVGLDEGTSVKISDEVFD